MKKIRSISEIKKLSQLRVLLRLDLDLPRNVAGQLEKNDELRLSRSLPTLKYLLKRRAQVIILGHFDRPQGKYRSELILKPIVEQMLNLLGGKDLSLAALSGFPAYKFTCQKQTVHVLENLRFHPGEALADKYLAQQLARLGDIYVNDAFATAHRPHASVSLLPTLLPAYAGYNLANEIKHLGQALDHPRRPLTIILGGVKGETKLKLAINFIARADYVLLGSALASNFYQALDFDIGNTKIDLSLTTLVRRLIASPSFRILSQTRSNILLDPAVVEELDAKKLKLLTKRLILPIDVVIAAQSGQKLRNQSYQVKDISLKNKKLTRTKDAVLDIGPKTIKLYHEIIRRSGTIIWNGPMGMFEVPPFNRGTKAVAAAALAARGKAIIGGGDTVAALSQSGLLQKKKRNVFISTGGGAMLEFLLNPKLPGIVPLIK